LRYQYLPKIIKLDEIIFEEGKFDIKVWNADFGEIMKTDHAYELNYWK